MLLPGQAGYCPACGQSVKTINRPWLEVAGEALVFTAHLFSAMFIILAAMLSIESAADRYLALLLLQLVLLLGMVVYTIIALHATYRAGAPENSTTNR